MPRLHFPEYRFKLQRPSDGGQSLKIFDIIRKKYVRLTPEEWVRQHLLHFLVKERNFPQSLISVEKKLLINNLEKRTDVVVYSTAMRPMILVECKAPTVTVTQAVFDQAARYNMSLKVDFFVITNGMETFVCKMDEEEQAYSFLREIPDYSAVKS
ncbi:MAG: type I restriction enzyme HsdR N-terminal domain-containing protein [Bacteroidetes bacterium]|nr:type I restriction enzyme HsdR N-terminal domain-containing protein [Bacteroidota bacterium]